MMGWVGQITDGCQFLDYCVLLRFSTRSSHAYQKTETWSSQPNPTLGMMRKTETWSPTHSPTLGMMRKTSVDDHVSNENLAAGVCGRCHCWEHKEAKIQKLVTSMHIWSEAPSNFLIVFRLWGPENLQGWVLSRPSQSLLSVYFLSFHWWCQSLLVQQSRFLGLTKPIEMHCSSSGIRYPTLPSGFSSCGMTLSISASGTGSRVAIGIQG